MLTPTEKEESMNSAWGCLHSKREKGRKYGRAHLSAEAKGVKKQPLQRVADRVLSCDLIHTASGGGGWYEAYPKFVVGAEVPELPVPVALEKGVLESLLSRQPFSCVHPQQS